MPRTQVYDPQNSRLWRSVANRFVVEKPLGEGGQATVWRAKQRSNGRACALKVMRSPLKTSKGKVKEIYYLTKVLPPHSNIIGVSHAFEFPEENMYGIALDLCDGSLYDVMRNEFKYDDTYIPEAFIWHCFAQAATALQVIHSYGVVHRDVKLENLLVRYRPGRSRQNSYPDIILSDFGGAAYKGEAGFEHVLEISTDCYVSPEAYGACKGDVWSLGVVLHKLMWNKLLTHDKCPIDQRTRGSPWSESLYKYMKCCLEIVMRDRLTSEQLSIAIPPRAEERLRRDFVPLRRKY